MWSDLKWSLDLWKSQLWDENTNELNRRLYTTKTIPAILHTSSILIHTVFRQHERENGHRRWTMVAAFLWPSYGYRQRPMAAALNCCSQAASYFGKKINRKRLYTLFQRQIMQNWLHLFIHIYIYILSMHNTLIYSKDTDMGGIWKWVLKSLSTLMNGGLWSKLSCAVVNVFFLVISSLSLPIIALSCLFFFFFLIIILSISKFVSIFFGFSFFFASLFVSEQARPWWFPWAMSVFSFMLNLRQGNMPGPDTWTFSCVFVWQHCCSNLPRLLHILASSQSLAFAHQLYSSRLYGFSLTERWKHQRYSVNPLMEWISEPLTVVWVRDFEGQHVFRANGARNIWGSQFLASLPSTTF